LNDNTFFDTKIIDELGFSWATDTIDVYDKKPILHMAGVQPHEKEKKFYKGEFTTSCPLEKLMQNFNHFEYVDFNSATIKYIETMKSLIKKTKN
jgi:hypothetical protein